jgi:hypothetical protein
MLRPRTVFLLVLFGILGMSAALGQTPPPSPPASPPQTPPEPPGMAKKASDLVVERMKATIQALSSPEAQGRGPGSAGLDAVAAGIIQGFKAAGLTSAGDGGSWTQEFTPSPAAIKNEIAPAQGKPWGSVALKNIIGTLPGSAGPDAPCVVVGAHYDHLGIAADGSRYPGADDNASGIAVLLELANRLRQDEPLRNTVVFAAFSGEEEGTLGSAYYAEHPVCPLERTLAMINFDTVGRMDGSKLYVFGAGSAAEFHEILKGINMGEGLDLITPDAAPFGSDQIPFFEKGVPVLHFFSGANADYHRPSDTEEKINYPGLLSVLDFAHETVAYLADREAKLTYVPPGAAKASCGPPAGTPPRVAGARHVSLGTIPDFSQDTGGVLLAGTTPGSPAEKAGLLKGDVLIKLGAVDVDNLSDLSAALSGHEPGDSVEVVVTRGGETISHRVVLERK